MSNRNKKNSGAGKIAHDVLSLVRKELKKGRRTISTKRQQRRQAIMRPGTVKPRKPRNKGKSIGTTRKNTIQKMANGVNSHALQYTAQLVAPHVDQNVTSGIPKGSKRSHKNKPFVEGEVIIGEDGVGFIGFNPATVNDKAAVWVSNSAFTGTSFPSTVLVAPGDNSGVTGYAMGNLPIAASNLTTNNCQSRVISSGFELYYTDQSLEVNGLYYGIAEPNHSSLLGKGLSYISQQRTKVVTSIQAVQTNSKTESKITMFALPISDKDQDYKPERSGDYSSLSAAIYPYAFDNNVADSTTSDIIAGFLIRDSVPGHIYHFKFWEEVELCGPQVQSISTDNPVAAPGSAERGLEAAHKGMEFHSSNNGMAHHGSIFKAASAHILGFAKKEGVSFLKSKAPGIMEKMGMLALAA